MNTNASNIVKLTFDPGNPPPVTPSERAELEAIAAMTDEAIDYIDAPYLPDAVWVKAVDFPPAKKLISLRIDEDVLDFFRHTGKRYQTRINAVLRSYVVEARKADADKSLT